MKKIFIAVVGTVILLIGGLISLRGTEGFSHIGLLPAKLPLLARVLPGVVPPESKTSVWNWNAIGNSSTGLSVAGIGDFNKDGFSDILMRDDKNGNIGYYDMTDGKLVWHLLGASQLAYSVAGVGDFNGDGMSDVLFRNSKDGNFGYDALNSKGVLEWNALAGSNAAYAIVGVGDFAKDGVSDALFRNKAGDIGFDDVKSGKPITWKAIGVSSPDFAVVAVADFTRDGISDILFRHANGDIGYYEITSSHGFIWHNLGTTGADYAVIGAKDFTGDGIPDIAVRKTTGETGYFEVTSASKLAWHSLGSTDSSYTGAWIGDFNNDQSQDVLLRNAAGALGYFSTKASASLITIPVRIHMLQSTDKSVQTILTEAQIRDIFTNALGVNEHYWKQAGIQFQIESVVAATPTQVANYGKNVSAEYALPGTYAEVIQDKTLVRRDDKGPIYQAVISLLKPKTGLLENGFNIVVVHDFGVMGGGIYLPTVAYVPEQSAKGNDTKTITFAFAHELGHSLSLLHYNADIDSFNLMAISNSNPPDKTHLTSDQIKDAQSQAKSGKPSTKLGSPN